MEESGERASRRSGCRSYCAGVAKVPLSISRRHHITQVPNQRESQCWGYSRSRQHKNTPSRSYGYRLAFRTPTPPWLGPKQQQQQQLFSGPRCAAPLGATGGTTCLRAGQPGAQDPPALAGLGMGMAPTNHPKSPHPPRGPPPLPAAGRARAPRRRSCCPRRSPGSRRRGGASGCGGWRSPWTSSPSAAP